MYSVCGEMHMHMHVGPWFTVLSEREVLASPKQQVSSFLQGSNSWSSHHLLCQLKSPFLIVVK